MAGLRCRTSEGIAMKRLHLVLLVLAALGMTTWPASAQDKYPSKPIKVILPYGPGIGDVPSFLMATNRNFPPKTLAEIIAYAKERPGKLKYASPGAGSFPHYDMEILAQRAGISMQVIHIKAGPPGYINDMTLGDIQLAYMNVATSAPQIQARTLRPVVTLTA